MGTLLYPSNTLAKEKMLKLFETDTKITTRQFLDFLINQCPDYDWTFAWCSRFLLENTYTIEKDSVRCYALENKLKQPILNAVWILNKFYIPVTKKNIKIVLKSNNITFTSVEFEKCFFEMKFKETGKYTSENHKIYCL